VIVLIVKYLLTIAGMDTTVQPIPHIDGLFFFLSWQEFFANFLTDYVKIYCIKYFFEISIIKIKINSS